jgi:ankyrin repeat protein
MFAVSHGHEEASTLLLNANANPSLKDEEGRTALYHAASKGHVAAMQILLKTNPDLIRSNGE